MVDEPVGRGVLVRGEAAGARYVTYNAAADGDWRDRYDADKRALLDDVGDAATVRVSVNDDFLGVPVDEAITGSSRNAGVWSCRRCDTSSRWPVAT